LIQSNDFWKSFIASFALALSHPPTAQAAVEDKKKSAPKPKAKAKAKAKAKMTVKAKAKKAKGRK